MRTITIQINDGTAEILDKVAGSYEFYKYPIEQAYSMIIEELLSTTQKAVLCTCCCVPEHPHSPDWCLRQKK